MPHSNKLKYITIVKYTVLNQIFMLNISFILITFTSKKYYVKSGASKQ